MPSQVGVGWGNKEAAAAQGTRYLTPPDRLNTSLYDNASTATWERLGRGRGVAESVLAQNPIVTRRLSVHEHFTLSPGDEGGLGCAADHRNPPK
ncbi:hypothetical protein O3P69_012192 [Scylla paramamosain]|uniref:Uncharacterized protein n=1 Tax=Scylla paramamosain TaxID=85552 RepID=A0AAW0TEY4_SCYPA